MTSVRAYWGADVDTSGSIWWLERGHKVNFELFERCGERAKRYLPSIESYLRDVIRRTAPGTARSYFTQLLTILRSAPILDSLENRETSLLKTIYVVLSSSYKDDYVFGAIATCRQWYLHGANRCLDGFDPDVANSMLLFSFGKRGRGFAVKRADPDEGPLSEGEARRLDAALYRAAAENRLPLKVVVAALLMTHFGSRPESLSRLMVGDLRVEEDGAFLVVPRVKTGHPNTRAALRDKPLNTVLRSLVAKLEAESAMADVDPLVGPERPLFLYRRKGDASDRPAPPSWFATIVRKLPRALELRHDDGRDMYLWPRRLRYTFARRHALRGTPPVVLMEMMDHANANTVMVYYEPGLELSDVLDRTIGAKLVELATKAIEGVAGPALRPRDPFAPPYPVPKLTGLDRCCLGCARFVAVRTEALKETTASMSRSRQYAEAYCSPGPALERYLSRSERLEVRAGNAR